MADAEPKLLLPILRPFYDAVIPLSWLIVRVAVGWNLLVHGWGKIMAGTDGGRISRATAIWASTRRNHGSGAAPRSKRPPELRLILGLFTRFFAAAVAMEMGYLTFIQYWHNGYGWAERRLRIRADVGECWGLDHRLARRRPLFARPQARARAVAPARALVSRRGAWIHSGLRTGLAPCEPRRGGRVVGSRRTRNAEYLQGYRGFKSLPLRQFQPTRCSTRTRNGAGRVSRLCRCRAFFDSADRDLIDR